MKVTTAVKFSKQSKERKLENSEKLAHRTSKTNHLSNQINGKGDLNIHFQKQEN